MPECSIKGLFFFLLAVLKRPITEEEEEEEEEDRRCSSICRRVSILKRKNKIARGGDLLTASFGFSLQIEK